MKVAIIGAGICGLYLAWKLAERREDVVVFERRGEIGKQVCSGLFSERILDFVPQSKGLIQNQIASALIHFPRKTIKIKFARKFLVMSHSDLDNLVADLARRAGAQILLNHNVPRTLLGIILNGFDRVIGCDGALSEVRKSLGLPEPAFRLAIQGFTPTNASAGRPQNFVETWPVKSGFIWRIPRGKELEYGIISNVQGAKPLFELFLNENKVALERTQSAAVPQGFILPKNQKITLCGDAMGITKPWSGGGVIWGLTAANILLKNFPDFLKYKNALAKFFLPKIIFSKIAVKAVYYIGENCPWILPKNIKIEGDFLI